MLLQALKFFYRYLENNKIKAIQMGAFSGLNNLTTLWVLHDKPNRLLVLESWSQLYQTMQRIQNEIGCHKKRSVLCLIF